MSPARPGPDHRPAGVVDAELPLVAATFDTGLLDDEPGTGPGATVHQLYHLARFERATGVSPAELDAVVEWDGGHGNLARLAWRIRGGRVTYVLIVPRAELERHRDYLSTALGDERVKLVDRPGSGIGGERVNVVSDDLIADIRLTCDLFVATAPLDAAAQDVVAARRWFGARHLLLATEDGDALGERAVGDGAAAEPVGDHAPGQRYLIR